MKFGFKLVEVWQGKKATIYALHIDGESQNEFYKFRDSAELRAEPDHRMILKRLGEIAGKYGCKPQWFKDEVRRTSAEGERRRQSEADSLRALHYENESLRLYCCLWGQSILILGNGGIKNVPAYQDDPFLNDCVAKLEYVDERLRECIQSKEIVVTDGGFTGSLTFDPQ